MKVKSKLSPSLLETKPDSEGKGAVANALLNPGKCLGSCGFQPNDNTRNIYGAITEKATGSKTPFQLSEIQNVKDEESDTNHCYHERHVKFQWRERTTVYGEGTFEKDLENWVDCHSVEGCGY